MARLPDLATFRLLYPEFASVPDPTVLLYLDEEELGMSANAWGRCYANAVMAYAAHLLALALARQSTSEGGVPQPSGIVQSGSMEGISFAFARMAPASATDEWLGQTPYGLMWASLRRSCLGRAMLSW